MALDDLLLFSAHTVPIIGIMGPAPFTPEKAMLQRFIFALFSKGPLSTNRESREGKARGEGSSTSSSGPILVGTPPGVAVSFLGLSEKHSSQTPREKKR
jgi:hypothetical protein